MKKAVWMILTVLFVFAACDKDEENTVGNLTSSQAKELMQGEWYLAEATGSQYTKPVNNSSKKEAEEFATVHTNLIGFWWKMDPGHSVMNFFELQAVTYKDESVWRLSLRENENDKEEAKSMYSGAYIIFLNSKKMILVTDEYGTFTYKK